MAKNRGTYRFRVENLREKGDLEDPGVDGKAILKCIFKE
jgi:hypothetical protein